MNTLAPICLFTYSRLEETKQTVEALQNNFLASQSNLFIFSDGPKNESVKNKVDAVREYIKTIKGFKSIVVFLSKNNKGLANSIIEGVTKIINQFGQVIVLEDDLVTTPNFLDYMNSSLVEFSNNDKVFSISGFSYQIDVSETLNYDNYFWGRANPWGWATWSNRWQKVCWNYENLGDFNINSLDRKRFNYCGSDLSKMLNDSIKGKIDSWYIRFNFAMFLNSMFTCYPKFSKVKNIGFNDNSTHTKKSLFETVKIEFDYSNNRNFNFNKTVEVDIKIHKKLYSYKSYKTRILRKIGEILNK